MDHLSNELCNSNDLLIIIKVNQFTVVVYFTDKYELYSLMFQNYYF